MQRFLVSAVRLPAATNIISTRLPPPVRLASTLAEVTRNAAIFLNTMEQASKGEQKKLSFFMAVNDALKIAMEKDPKACLFGEDVAFGGVFRCSSDLQQQFGPERVFNTPLSEQGIAGFAVGMAAQGSKSKFFLFIC